MSSRISCRYGDLVYNRAFGTLCALGHRYLHTSAVSPLDLVEIPFLSKYNTERFIHTLILAPCFPIFVIIRALIHGGHSSFQCAVMMNVLVACLEVCKLSQVAHSENSMCAKFYNTTIS